MCNFGCLVIKKSKFEIRFPHNNFISYIPTSHFSFFFLLFFSFCHFKEQLSDHTDIIELTWKESPCESISKSTIFEKNLSSCLEFGLLTCVSHVKVSGSNNQSPKGNMWSAIPVALLRMLVIVGDGQQGSSPEGDDVLQNTGGLSFIHLSVRMCRFDP